MGMCDVQYLCEQDEEDADESCCSLRFSFVRKSVQCSAQQRDGIYDRRLLDSVLYQRATVPNKGNTAHYDN